MSGTEIYYAPLGELLQAEFLPADWGFLTPIFDNFMSDIRYNNLVKDTSPYNDVKSYSLDLVIKELTKQIPGTEIELALFRGESGVGFIPVSLEVRWEILRYVMQFNSESFDATALSFVKLLLDITGSTREQFLTAVTNLFFLGSNPLQTFLADIRQRIDDDDLGFADIDGEISQEKTSVLNSIDQLISELSNLPQTSSTYDNLHEYVIQSLEQIEESLDITIDINLLAYRSISHGIMNFDEAIDQIVILFKDLIRGFSWDDFLDMLIPQFEVSVTDINAALRFPRSWLRPTWFNPSTKAYEEYPLQQWRDDKGDQSATEDDMRSALNFTFGSASYSTQYGFKFSGALSTSLAKSMIADTGMTITLENVVPDFSRTTNISQASAAGYPVDFVGAYVEYAAVELPGKWFARQQDPAPGTVTLGIVAEQALFGTGGITGKFSLQAVKAVYDPDEPNDTKFVAPLPGDPPAPEAELLFILGKNPDAPTKPRKGFSIGFKSFDLTLKQGAFIGSNIAANLYIPKFDGKPIGVKMSLDHDGDFEISATLPNPVPEPGDPPEASLGHIYMKNLFALDIDTLAVGRENDIVYLETSGSLHFTNSLIETIIEGPLGIKKLRINSDGGIEIAAGTLPLPKNQELKIGPATISITAIHCGTMKRGNILYRYWGFDGGLSVNPGGVDARGDGIKFCYDPDNPSDFFLHIEGIGLNLTIPGSATKESAAVLIQGYLSLKDPVYKGSIALQLPKMQISGGAEMMYNTQEPSFVIDAWLDLPNPILIGSTTLGIYGFRGLLGMRYAASKTILPDYNDDSSWFDWYSYTDGIQIDRGVDIEKLVTPDDMAPGTQVKNPFTIGAGVTVATTVSNAFSAKFFLLISIPTLILLDGRANILGERVGLDDEDPPFWAFISFSPTDSALELGLGADYKLPRDTGRILDLKAAIEAGFFFKDKSAWYINAGTISNPISAKLLTVFDAFSYLMLSARGIKAGAGISFKFEETYLGVVDVRAEAFFKVWGQISFERPQIGGGIAVGGSLSIKLFGFGLSASLAAILTVEASEPFRIAGSAEICVGVDLFFKRIEKCFNVEFVWMRSQNVDETPVGLLAGPMAPEASSPATAIHMQSGRTYENALTFAPGLISNVQAASKDPLPLDSFIDLKFLKPLKPLSMADKIGGLLGAAKGDVERVPPSEGSRVVTHSYDIDSLAIEVWANGTWQDYHPYKALSDLATLDPAQVDDIELHKLAYWQKDGAEYNKIRFLAGSPFSYMNPVGGYLPETMDMDAHSIYCAPAERKRHCVTWEDVSDTQSPLAKAGVHFKDDLFYEIIGPDGQIDHAANVHGITRSLILEEHSHAALWFAQPARNVTLRLGSCVSDITVFYERRIIADDREASVQNPVAANAAPQFEILESRQLTRADLAPAIQYSGDPIDRIRIVPAAQYPGVEDFFAQFFAMITDAIIALRLAGNHDLADQYSHILSSIVEQYTGYINKLCRQEPERDGGHIKEQLADNEAKQKQISRKLRKLRAQYSKHCPVNIGIARADIQTIARRNAAPATLPPTPRLKASGASAKSLRAVSRLEASHKKLRQETDAAATLLRADLARQMRECQTLSQEISDLQQELEGLKNEAADLRASLEGLSGNGDKEGYACGCATFIHEVCWMSETDALYNEALPSQADMDEDYGLMREAMNHIVAPIWRPDETYRISITLTDTVSGPYSNSATPQTYSVGFRTEGPLGFYDEAYISGAPEPAALTTPADPQMQAGFGDAAVQAPETQLAYYVDDRRSFPDPSGKILYAKPLYWGAAQMDLAFSKPYAHHFFAHWPAYGALDAKTYDMEIDIIDPSQVDDPGSLDDHLLPVINEADRASAAPQWIADPLLPAKHDVTALQNMRDVSDPCWTPGDPLAPAALKIEAPMADLKPKKTYTAVIKNTHTIGTDVERAEILRYPFVTSAYETFEDHIRSYQRRYKDETDDAFFIIDLELGQTQNAAHTQRIRARNIVKYNQADEDTQYRDAFDSLIFGVFGLTDLDPAMGTEINYIRETTTDKVIAVWIRSNEPLNDPRLTDTELDGSIIWKRNNVPSGNTYVLHSKDRCEAIIMRNYTVQMSATSLDFNRLQWSGGILGITETVAVDITYNDVKARRL